MYNIQVHVPYEKQQYIKKMNYYMISLLAVLVILDSLALIVLFFEAAEMTGAVECHHWLRCGHDGKTVPATGRGYDRRRKDLITITQSHNPPPWLRLCQNTLTTTKTPRLRYDVVMRCIVTWRLSSAMISSLHNSIHPPGLGCVTAHWYHVPRTPR